MVWRSDLLKRILDQRPSSGGAVIRLGKPTPELLKKADPDIRAKLEGKSLSPDVSWINHLYKRGHYGPNEDDPRNVKLEAGDFDLIPSIWRNPDTVGPGEKADEVDLTMETFDGCILHLGVKTHSGTRAATFYKQKAP